MAIYKQGVATSIGTRFVNSISNTGGGNSGVQSLANIVNNLSNTVIPVRVTDVVLNDKHPKYTDVGKWNGIGAVFFQYIDGTTPANSFAYPFFPHINDCPLVNEVVFLISIPSKFMDGNNTYISSYYYLPATGIWNHPHHNAYPDIKIYKEQEKQDGKTDIDLNSPTNQTQQTFQEKSDIHPILPFTGDIIHQGRWGNSLRFGSTSKPPQDIPLAQLPSPEYQNNWSTAGTNGDPITIVRNGQPTNVNDEGWIPIVENISSDLSSIYLTSYQQLNTFKVASELYQSYKTPPIFPSQYRNPQVILNSDRIVINAKTDSILLSAQQSIGMSTNGSVNVDATSHYISSNDIKLGSKNATQPVLLGNDTIETLKQLTSAIKDLATILQVQRDYPEGKLVTSYNAIAGNVMIVLDNITKTLNDNSLKSQTTKVQ
jgi:hypothetical protein